MRKVGFSFHETMKLRRINLSQALECVREGATTPKEIGERTSLGSNEAKTAPSYLRACGMMTWERELTNFGDVVGNYDQLLSMKETQWLIHYFLCAPHEMGPAFWGKLASKHFIIQHEPFGSEPVQEDLSAFAVAEGRAIIAGTIQSTANIFLKAYSEIDGLGQLEILEESPKDTYTAFQPIDIPWRVMAYVLADFWAGNWGETLSVPFAQINGESGPAALMLLNSGQMSQLMRPIQEVGLLEINRITRPWTVVRKWSNAATLLEAAYANADD